MQQQAPLPPLPPLPPRITPENVLIDGVAITNAQAVYQGFRAQRRELNSQLERLSDTRGEIAATIQGSTSEADKKGLEQRLASVDERIAALDKQIAETDAQIAKAIAVPGAAIDLPDPGGSGSDDEGVYIISTIFILAVLMPMAIAMSRRIWRRSAKVVTTFPKELSDRLLRVEQAVESTAVEVERIGEGQRFMTRLFTEGAGAQSLAQRQADRLPAQSQG